jgi:hypothetical protein
MKNGRVGYIFTTCLKLLHPNLHRLLLNFLILLIKGEVTNLGITFESQYWSYSFLGTCTKSAIMQKDILYLF